MVIATSKDVSNEAGDYKGKEACSRRRRTIYRYSPKEEESS
jgi:hypothetical protein